MTAFLPAITWVLIGLYAYFAVAPGAASIPLQFGMSGDVNVSAPRVIGFGLIPAVGLVAIVALSLFGAGATIGGAVIFCTQILHILMLRNWYAKSRA